MSTTWSLAPSKGWWIICMLLTRQSIINSPLDVGDLYTITWEGYDHFNVRKMYFSYCCQWCSATSLHLVQELIISKLCSKFAVNFVTFNNLFMVSGRKIYKRKGISTCWCTYEITKHQILHQCKIDLFALRYFVCQNLVPRLCGCNFRMHSATTCNLLKSCALLVKLP